METQEGGGASCGRGSDGFGFWGATGQSENLWGHQQRTEGHLGLLRHRALQPGGKAGHSLGDAMGTACGDELGEGGIPWDTQQGQGRDRSQESREPRKAGRTDRECGGQRATGTTDGGKAATEPSPGPGAAGKEVLGLLPPGPLTPGSLLPLKLLLSAPQKPYRGPTGL